MKIVLNSENKDNCPLNLAIFLATLYYNANTSNIIKLAITKGYLTFRDTKSSTDFTKFEITPEGIKVIESILLNSEITEQHNNVDRFTSLAAKLRELYPTGRKAGTAYQWRDSIAVISLRLKALVKKYGNCFTDEQAIEATRKYVASFNGNYTYMQLLKYFIMKNNMSDRAEDTSQLLSYIENLEGEDITRDNGELV